MLSKNFPISFASVRKKILPKTILSQIMQSRKVAPRGRITKFSNNWGQDNDGRYRTVLKVGALLEHSTQIPDSLVLIKISHETEKFDRSSRK